jgi:ribosome biogenesis GTPase
MNLEELGWNQSFDRYFEQSRNQSFIPARVAQEHKNKYLVYSEQGELKAEISGKFRHGARSRGEFPAVGDWVALSARPKEGRATIHSLLPRKNSFSRKAVLSGGMPDSGGKTEEQVLAANVDKVFLVSGLDGEFHLRRIERYLTVAWDSGTTPVIVLNKADVCTDIETLVGEVQSIALGVAVHAISAAKNAGLDALQQYLINGRTAAFLGSSGVGKSTIINCLLGMNRLKVGVVREYDSKGRHTTSYREMILLPNGGIVIDTPGMREIQMWGDEEGLKRTFDDIEELATQCRFRDCRHEGEPGCAIGHAVTDGTLDTKRFHSYLKQKKELDYLAVRKDQRAKLNSKKRWKEITLAQRKLKKSK